MICYRAVLMRIWREKQRLHDNIGVENLIIGSFYQQYHVNLLHNDQRHSIPTSNNRNVREIRCREVI